MCQAVTDCQRLLHTIQILLRDLINTLPGENLHTPFSTDVTIRSLNRIETNQHGAIGRLEGGEVRHGVVPLITFVL
jgi:hypothetical protein